MRYLLLLITLSVSVPAYADKKTEAKEHFDKAGVAHKEGRYEDALTELNIAYTLDPAPAYLYAIGQVHVMMGQCNDAVTFYQRFLDTKPSKEAADKAQEAIDTCKRLEPQKEKPQPEKIYVNKTTTIHTRTRPWYTDGVGDTFLILGVAAGGVGGFFYGKALTDRDEAEKAMDYQSYDSLVARAQDNQRLALIIGAGAGVAVTAAVIIYLARDRTVETRSIAVAPTSDGALVTWAGRF
jgi:tetratricopeptide (TPR) repeat protein